MFLDKSYIPLKTSIDVAWIRKSCRICEEVLIHLNQYIEPGITTLEIDRIAESFILKRKARPVIKGYKGFPGSICTSVNNIIAHGTPSSYSLKDGDIISIDITVEKNGWYGDGAWTFIAGTPHPDTKRLLKAAWQGALAGISAIKDGAFSGDIGHFIEQTVNKNGCSVIREFVGHGIGTRMHEEPSIPHFGQPNTGIRIVPGMVFTIEPAVCLGTPDVIMTETGWDCMTRDNSFSAQFENTIAVFKNKVEILTLSEGKLKDFIDYPPGLM